MGFLVTRSFPCSTSYNGQKHVSTASLAMSIDSSGGYRQPRVHGASTFMKAGPSIDSAFSTLSDRSFGYPGVVCATYGMLCAIMISVSGFGNSFFPGMTFPAGVVEVAVPLGVPLDLWMPVFM